MSETSEIPTIKYLDAIKPENAGMGEDVLRYENLGRAVVEYSKTNNQREDAFWDAEPGGVQELKKARQLAFEYFVATADKAVQSGSHNRDLWANRYTQASAELFGLPDAQEATRLVRMQAHDAYALRSKPDATQTHIDTILEQYAEIANPAIDTIEQVRETEVAAIARATDELAAVLQVRYAPVMDLVEAASKQEFEPADLTHLFSDALAVLGDIDDPEWKDWNVVSTKFTSVSVQGKDKEVRIPINRGASSINGTKKLLAHELVHMLRAKNGLKSGNELLCDGYPGYLEGEEGLAILSGAAISGEITEVIKDRYIDVAIAAGVIGEKPKNRQQIHELAYARQYLRAEQLGSVNEQALSRKVSAYVDRVFRGGPGDTIGERQAVYTGDISYYEGLHSVSAYIVHQLDEGRTMTDLFDYLMQGKFDPTNQMHTEDLAK